MITLNDETGVLSEKELNCIEQAAQCAFSAQNKKGNVFILLTEPEAIRSLNYEHRNVDCVTDVLSFPSAEAGETPADGFWGDIVICPARAREQAMEYGHSPQRELAFLTVHGMLHLFGFDHLQPDEEAIMIAEQKRILERMGLSR